MSVQLLAFVFGGILLFVGVLGGGFEVKELKIPKVGIGVRLLSAIIGLVFIGLGFSGLPEPGQPDGRGSSRQPVVWAAAPQDPVEFFLTDQLGDEEVSEQVTVLIDGKNVDDLTVNQTYPSSRLRVSVPQSGQHSYVAEATAVFNDHGTTFQYAGAGQGMINVRQGRIYSLRGSVSGSTWLVSIEEEE